MKIKKFVKLLFCILICEGAGAIGSIATSSSVDSWYASLNKPLIAPPGWLFAPVWTIIYALMGIALFLVLEKNINKVKAIWIFSIQLLLNVLWSFIFFGFQMPFLAFLEIIVLWIFIFIMIKGFVKIEKRTKWLLLPYIIWTSFAAILNFWFWIIN